jgi:ring-1,2-phenylacetyl-CoA epoxidase subunit PaaB
MNQQNLPLYEVFVRSKRGLSEGVSIWVMRSGDITASQESDVEMFCDPMDDKPYRHATHFNLPKEVDNM